MKRFITLIAAVSVAVAAGAQDMYDALRFSETDYSGTARTLAMGNAFTALGEDLGSLTINPAGSAVAPYSQITLTPGMVLAVNTSNGVRMAEGAEPNGFGTTMRNTKVGFYLPNLGFTVSFETGGTMKRISVGFVSNVSNTFHDALYAQGVNVTSSFATGMASMATGLEYGKLDQFVKAKYDDNYIGPSDWKYALAFDSYMIDPKDDTDPECTDYIGVTGNGLKPAGAVSQNFGRDRRGVRHDYVFNLGLNFSDYVYVGANLGIVGLKYSNEEYINETPEEPDLFHRTGFRKLNYKYEYSASGNGLYGKFGVIVTPFSGLRIGAAFQTPTMTVIKETWGHSASVERYGENTTDITNCAAETPIGDFKYKLLSPMRFNAGLAWTFGKVGLVSADYEMCNYKGMRFKQASTSDNSEFNNVNGDISSLMGVSHMLRAGVEVKPFEGFAIRAGYGLTMAPDSYLNAEDILVKNKAKDHKFSFGLGYRSNGSLFFDVAAAVRKFADEYVMPYETALVENNAVVMDGTMPVVDYASSPEILTRKMMWTIALTIGFRF